MQLRVLGCSGGIGPDLGTTSLLIDDDIMIDAGSGLGTLNLEEMSCIRHVFVTHSHLDHIAFIPLLVDTIFDRISEPLVIHGQESTLKALKEHIFNWVVWPDFAELPHAHTPVLRYEVMAPGETLDIDGRSIEMIPVNHVVPAVAYRVEHNGKSFAFSGDTTTNDSFWEALNAHDGLDVLIVECAFANHDLELSRLARHYCPSLLVADLQKLRHEPEVFITHLKPGEETTIMAECAQVLADRGARRLGGDQVFAL